MPKRTKQKAPLSRTSAAAETSLIVTRPYKRNELDAGIQHQLNTHPNEFKQLIPRLEAYTPENLPQELKSKALTALIEYTKLLNLLNSDEKLKNFQDAYFNSEYFKISYSLKIASLSFYLKRNDKIYPILHQALMEYNHPTVIKIYFMMIQKELISSDDEINFTYMMKIIQRNIARFGNRLQRDEIQTFFSCLLGTQENGLVEMSDQIFQYYYSKKDFQNIKALLALLYTSTEPSVLEQAHKILATYLQFYLEQANFEEVDSVLDLFKKFVQGEHYFLASTYALETENTHGLAKIYSEKGLALGNLNCMTNLAAILVYSNEDILRALKLIKEIQKRIGKVKANDVQSKLVRGRCFHLLGRIHDFGLLPPNYLKNDKLAFEYYSKACDDKNMDACQDLGIMYQVGQGIPQDLEKSEILLSQVQLDRPEVLINLAEIQLMRAAKAPKEDRDRLIKLGIDKINEALIKSPDKSHAHLTAAMLLMAHDMGINVLIEDNQKVFCGFETPKFFAKHDILTNTNIESIKAHLIAAAEKGQFIGFYMLGCLFYSGNYFERDLSQAEYFFKCFYETNSEAPTELVTLFLLQYFCAKNNNDKERFLSQAMSWHRFCLERIDFEDKITLEKNFQP